jgi:hypothetical protein
MSVQTTELIGKFVFALIFGAIFCLLLTFTPLAYLYKPTDCWDYQADFLYSYNQLGLTVGAVSAFFVQSLMKFQGWKGFFKMIAAMFLCFLAYPIASEYYDIHKQQCYFPLSPGAIPESYWTKILLVSLIKSAVTTIICLPVLIVYKRVLTLLFSTKNNFLKLDLNAK